jgi:nucleoside-diphosphate-sugar epimerase
MPEKVLVTGSSGFLGRALTRSLREQGHQVLGFGRTPLADSLVGSLTNPDDVQSALSSFEPNIVFNLASQTDTAPGVEDFSVNTAGVANLLEAVANSASIRRAIWVSSQLVCAPGYQPVNEEDYNPSTPYGESKMIGEQLVRRSDGGGKCWTIVRPTSVWGPGMGPHYMKLLHLIRRGLYFHIGSRPVRKSFAFIDNIVRQVSILASADSSLINGQTFYLADSEPIEIRSWCDLFARLFGTRIRTVPLSAARILARMGDIAQSVGLTSVPFTTLRLKNILTEYVVDIRPIEAICGASVISIEEGVRRTAEWFQSSTPPNR